MGRALLAVGVLVGSLALPATGLRATPVAQRAVLLRYHYAPGETLAYAYRERLVKTSATARTTALLTFRQWLRVTRVSAAGVATAVLTESPHTLVTTGGGRSGTTTQAGPSPLTMALYPDGHSSVLVPRPVAGGPNVSAPEFPARPVAPGARWTRQVTLPLGDDVVSLPVAPVTEHLTFTGYGVVNGERVAQVTIAMRVQRAATTPPGGAWPNTRVLVTIVTTLTRSIGLTSGTYVREVMDRTTTVRAVAGAASAAPGVLSTLTTHTVISRI